jgi:ribonuclease HI
MNHPHASLQNVLTFMWCMWKSRNDCLFGRKPGNPLQINQVAEAISKNLEMVDMTQKPNKQTHHNTVNILQVQNQEQVLKQGETITSDLQIKCSRIYSDAAWKVNADTRVEAKMMTGLGIYCRLQEPNCKTSLFIQALIPATPSVIQAEAEALVLAAKVAKLLHLNHVSILTDNITVARAATTSLLAHQQVPWEIRQQIAKYKAVSQSFFQVYHIRRNLNSEAHKCAQQALRQSMSTPIFTCLNSSHRETPCPLQIILPSLQAQGYVINDVSCL